MSKDAEVSTNERAFILNALRGKARLDGRSFDQFRPVSISFGDEYGNVRVQLGKTRCLFYSQYFAQYFAPYWLTI